MVYSIHPMSLVVRRERAAILVLVAIGLGLCACGKAPSSRFSQRIAPIIGGAPHSGHPAVGYLLINAADGRSENICTATLIGPRVLLTAAHCLPDLNGDKQHLVEFDEAVFEVERFVRHPNWRPNGPNYVDDIGLAFLRLAPPIEVGTIAALAPRPSMPLTLVGFGRSNPADADTRGSKRISTNLSISTVQSKHFTVAGYQGNSALGDSGGPVFTTLAPQSACGATCEVIVGVQSTSTSDFRTSFNPRLDVYLDWIDAERGGLDVSVYRPQLPVVAIATPVAGAAVASSLVLRATVTHPLAIETVEIWVDDSLFSALVQPPYDFALSLPLGQHRLRVVARDSAGSQGQAEIGVTVVDDPPITPDAGVVPNRGDAVAVGSSDAATSDAANRRKAGGGCALAAARQRRDDPILWPLIFACLVTRRRSTCARTTDESQT